MTGQSKIEYNREGFVYKLYNESCEDVYIGSTRDIIEIIKTLTEEINIGKMILNYGHQRSKQKEIL